MLQDFAPPGCSFNEFVEAKTINKFEADTTRPTKQEQKSMKNSEELSEQTQGCLKFDLIGRAPEGEVTLVEKHGTGPSKPEEEEENHGPE